MQETLSSQQPDAQPQRISNSEEQQYDDSAFNSDADDEDGLEKIQRFFTGESSAYYGQDDEDLNAREREYVTQLLSEEGEAGLSVGRFEGWLGKTVLLQGKIFITNRYFLFYAHLPVTNGTLKASPLAKKSVRHLVGIGKASYIRFWFVLRAGALLWYEDPGDIFFPAGLLSLNLMSEIRVVPEAPEKFCIKSLTGKVYTFKADSRNAANEWVKAIEKEIFKARNNNTAPSVVVRIPLKNMISLKTLKPLDFVDVIEFLAITQGSVNPAESQVGKFTFAFFGDQKTLNSIIDRISTSTNNFEHQKGVKFNTTAEGEELDLAHSQVGPVDESVFDTTRASNTDVFEFKYVSDDREAVRLAGEDETESGSQVSSQLTSEHSSSLNLSPISSHGNRRSFFSKSSLRSSTLLHSRIPTRSGTPSKSPTPTDSYSHSKSKTNLFSTLNEKLHKLKHDDSKIDLAPIIAMPKKLIPNLGEQSHDVSDTEEGADSDDDEESQDDSKINLNLPQVLSQKLSIFSSDPSTDTSMASEAQSSQLDLNSLNQKFRERFGLPSFVNLLAEYQRSFKKPNDSSSWSGTLLVASDYLCFNRQKSGSSCHRMIIPLKDIIHIKKEPMQSSNLEFEVAETAYSEFSLKFPEPADRKDADDMTRSVWQQQRTKDEGNTLRGNSNNHDTIDSEAQFLEYSLRSARLSTYEPTVTSQLKRRIPPLMFDPTSTQYKEIFLQKPMKTLTFAMMMIGSRGDVQPYLALCQGLMEEGHKCIILTHGEFKETVEGYGIEFREIAGDPRELMELMISHGSISYSFIREVLSHFKSWLKELMKTAWKAMKDSGADVFIESPSSMIGIHIAEALNIAYYRAFTMPWTKTKAYPQALLAPDQKRAGNYNAFTYVMYDRLVWFGISKYVNKWRKHMGLPETDLDTLHQEDVPFLYCVSPTVLVPPLDQPDWVHTCGYWELRPNEDKKESGDAKVAAFIKKAREDKVPVGYIGFGSIIVSDPEAMTQTIIDAVDQSGVRCVVARGWSSRSTKKKDNDDESDSTEKKPLNHENICDVDSVDHQWLFPQMDVCVHHGGSGTTGASLRAGKPTIIKPFFGDQFFYGRRVEDLGVGRNLKKLSTKGLAEALKECTTNKQMIRQADVLGEQIRHEHGVEEAILCIYRELAYAKDVTIRRRNATLEASKNGLFSDPLGLLNPAELFSHKDRSEAEILEKEDGGAAKNKDKDHLWFTLPKFGRREEQRQNRDADDEIDVSV
uniref:Sterol 3-beta-glucosyltransferase n=1 Tax=Starmerella bombicola TaxID=75736 RepID=G4RIN9_STABO|nr:glycosyltransferase [Starmerella bombicola]